MNMINKQQTIRQNLEQLVLDIPAHVLFLENIANSLDEKIAWKEFKFCFKLATSQIVSKKKNDFYVNKFLGFRKWVGIFWVNLCSNK